MFIGTAQSVINLADQITKSHSGCRTTRRYIEMHNGSYANANRFAAEDTFVAEPDSGELSVRSVW
jgi:hypothetical protein